MRFVVALLLLVLALAPARAENLWETLPVPAAMPTADKSGLAPVNGIEMYYAVYGPGTEGRAPVLLLHGGLGNADYWGNQVPALTAAGYQVIVADSRGHGRSTRNAEPYGYRLMAEDVLALLDYLKVDKVALIGWSDGGIIGLEIAMTYPERLARLFAYGANYDPAGLRADIGDSKVFNAYIERAGEDYAKLSPTPGEYDAFLEQIGQMWATQPNYTPDQLKAIAVKTTIADGAHDEGIKQEHTAEMAGLIPGAKLVVLPDLSHFGMWQDPAIYNATLLEFLKD
jgi:pimeloyl-ACP methyl ester carboxylesterase